MDVHVKNGDSMLNSALIIGLFGWLDPLYALFVQYLITFCSPPAATSDVISGAFVWTIFPNEHVQFRDHHLNRTREIPPEAIGGSIFNSHCEKIFFMAHGVNKDLVVDESGKYLRVVEKCSDLQQRID